MKTKLLTLLTVVFTTLSYSQTFTDNGLNYNVISTNPNEVEVTGGTVTNPLTIPSTVTDGTDSYTVTEVGSQAFRNKGVTSVILPNTLRIINFRGFRDNGNLTSVTLPASVTNVNGEAFLNSGLNEVIAEGTVPANISNSSFGTRANVDLIVPDGFEATYISGGWTGFRTVNGEIPVGGTFDVGDLRYRVTSQNPLEVEVAGRLNGIVDVVIPASVVEPQLGDTYTVTAIGSRAFRNAGINSVSFSNTIEVIKNEAFENNNLTTVTLPASLITIDNEAFNSNNSLIEVILDAVAAPTIQTNSFTNRGNINLTVPNGSETVYENSGWTGFFSVNGIPSIGSDFSVDGFNYRINGVNPNTVELRSGGNGITDLVLPSTTTKNGISFTVNAIGFRAFRGRNLNSVVLPQNADLIGNEAFESNNLTTITLPASVATIENEAFRDNPLTEIISQAVTAPTLETDNSITNRGNISLTVPNGSETIYENGGWTGFFSVNGIPSIGSDFSVDGFNYRINGVNPNTVELRSGGNGITDLVLPSTTTKNGISFTVTAVGFRAFRNKGINSVVFPQNIEVIDAEAFELNNLTAITFPASVTTIGEDAFLNNALTQVTFTSGPETIGVNAFRGNQLTNLSIPLGTVAIENGAFSNNQISSLSLPNSIDIIDEAAFLNNQIGSLVIPTGVITIGRAAFRDNRLTNVIFPNTVETIDTDAFLNNQLVNITLPSSLTTLGSAAFRNNQLTSIVIPDGITELRPQTFRDNDLISVTLPANLQTIRNDVFRNNEIESISFPESLIELQGFSFRNNKLTSVTIPANITTIAANTFNANLLTTITIPSNITSIENDAFSSNPLANIIADSETPAAITASSFGTRSTINLTIIPNQQSVIDDYVAAGWTGFGSVNGDFQIGAQFTAGDFRYEVTSVSPNEVKVLSRVTTEQNISIPEIVTEAGTTFTITAIENNAFQNTDITSVTLPASITTIGSNSFSLATLEQVEALGTAPATIESNSFGERENIALTVPSGNEIDYENAGWTGFFTINGNGLAVGNTFTVNAIRYEILTLAPNTLSAVGQNGTVPNGDFVFPELISKNGVDFTITTIGNEAFRNRGVQTLQLPSTLTTLEGRAFRDNGSLRSTNIPVNITSIGGEAFFDNGLTEIISESVNPPTINNGTINPRNNINLFIPQGTMQAYLDNGWTGFKSIIEQGTTILEPKVFLQGAYLNPNTGEETLMRDDLRVAGLIPTTSPYSDALAVNASVFNVEGENAIVDWVFVELRDAFDLTNIIEARSALLQRDGDIVDLNGLGILQFTAPNGNYFVAIKHRNHLGIVSNSLLLLDGNRLNLDFTNTATLTLGTNAQTNFGMPENTLGMWAGDANSDGVVRFSGANAEPTDIRDAVLNNPDNIFNSLFFAAQGYLNEDINMDGELKFSAGNSEPLFIRDNILGNPGNVFNSLFSNITSQIPQN
ncbi:leucine-rich repeat protein [Winogradskyella jejuensis]|uniref:Leucine rich repeat-containing protein n=1 Tax=Winogradskyella jejuensis TaxID=1089305 RepID=A0A1M5MCX6_9FLAO|nr:leucine-rich repeat protein [Winogradskyella jejuensis]SHG75190.1 Leucine rich repeat-containing protein [Winogradskyella jejuensis]